MDLWSRPLAFSRPSGAADTGGQVVYALETGRKLAQLGYEVDIWTRQFESQSDYEVLCPHARIVRAPCGGPDFILMLFATAWISNGSGDGSYHRYTRLQELTLT